MLIGWPDWVWIDERGNTQAAPEAWAPGRLWLRNQPPQLERLSLWRDGQALNLILIQHPVGRRLVAEWPAAEPGFHRVSWHVQSERPATTLIFTGLRHLQATEWLVLIEELHWELPARLLWSFQASRGLVPLRTQTFAPPASPQTSLGVILALWEGGWQGQPGLRDLLKQLERAEPELLPQQGFYKLAQVRRWAPGLLYRDPRGLSPHRVVWQERIQASLNTPRHQWVAATVRRLSRELKSAQKGLWRMGQAEAAERASRAQRELERLWRRHPLHQVLPALPEPEREDPVLQRCRVFYQVLERGVTPALGGAAWVATQPFALLYQHWCLLQLAHALQHWGQQRGAQQLYLATRLQAGKALLKLRFQSWQLTVIPEMSYTHQGEWISLSHLQRPDISLQIHQPTQASRLIVCDTKFRRGPEGPLKSDLDKLHAYRDAIRHADGRAAIERAVLLYPGPERHYHGALSAWSARPASDLTRWQALLDELLPF
ncbi:MAG: nuclease domain-containing protein [Candidatus Sericytochromatia bacterium]